MSAASEVLICVPVFPLTRFWRLHYLKYARESSPDVAARGSPTPESPLDSREDANQPAQPSLPGLERQLGSGRYFRDSGACAKPLAKHVSLNSKSIKYRFLGTCRRGLAIETAEIGPDERMICQWFPLT